IPNQTITLGPSNGPLAARTCQVDILMVAKKLPANPANGVAGLTDTLGRTSLQGVTSGVSGSATSTSQITVVAAPTPPTAVPTLPEWVMIMLAGVLVFVGAITLRRRAA